MRRTVLALTGAAVVAAVLAAPAVANHSWGGYHWARTANPFTVALGDNVSSTWDSYLGMAASDWSVDAGGNPVNATVATGASNPRNCRPTSGRLEVCNSTYGQTGWLGVAQIWASGTHITQGT